MTLLSAPARRPVAGVIAILLLVAACGGSDDVGTVLDSVDEPDVTTTTEPDATTTTSTPELTAAEAAPDADEPAPASTSPAPAATVPAPADTAAAPASTSPAPAASELPDCLIGDWIVNDAEMNAYYMALGENSGAGLEIVADGNMLITMTATDYVFTGDYTVNINVAGQAAKGVATGTATGTWTVEDGIIQSSLTESNLNIEVFVDGISFDGSDIGNSLLRSDPFASTPASCDGPTLMFQAGPTEDIRHPVLLTPA